MSLEGNHSPLNALSTLFTILPSYIISLAHLQYISSLLAESVLYILQFLSSTLVLTSSPLALTYKPDFQLYDFISLYIRDLYDTILKSF